MLEALCMNDHIFFYFLQQRSSMTKERSLKRGSVIVFQALRKFRVESQNIGTTKSDLLSVVPAFQSAWIIRFFEKIASFGINFKNKK